MVFFLPTIYAMELVFMKVICVLSILAGALLSTVSFAASFDCSKAKSFSEKAICTNPDLSAMDDNLLGLYKSAKNNATDAKAFKDMTRAMWNQREACATEECVRTWYSNAETVYTKLSAKALSSVKISKNIESRFVSIVSQAQNENSSASNDMARGGIKASRDEKICSIISGSKVENWNGKIKTLSSNSDGKGVLAIEIAPGIILTTHNNSFSDSLSNISTLIEPSSELFKKASSMKVGEDVTFSGVFIPGNESCIDEKSLSLQGGLSEPEFIFKFEGISEHNVNLRNTTQSQYTPEETKKATEALNEIYDSFAKVCVLIGEGKDDAAKNVINSIASVSSHHNDINQSEFDGVKEFFLQYRNLTVENCKRYSVEFIKMAYSNSQN